MSAYVDANRADRAMDLLIALDSQIHAFGDSDDPRLHRGGAHKAIVLALEKEYRLGQRNQKRKRGGSQ